MNSDVRVSWSCRESNPTLYQAGGVPGQIDVTHSPAPSSRTILKPAKVSPLRNGMVSLVLFLFH
jgi:hypothetical protein